MLNSHRGELVSTEDSVILKVDNEISEKGFMER